MPKISLMMKTKITVVRHGETEWNKALKLQGHQNSELTNNGIEQAKKLAETIRLRKFDNLISSDLGRAVHTAQIINKHMNLEIAKDISLRERAFGVMEGFTKTESQQNNPEIYEAYMQDKIDYVVPNGESHRQFYERVITGFQNIAEKYNNRHILVVAHGGVLDCVMRRIFNLELGTERSYIIPNTSVNTFTINNNEWLLEEWGNIEHLKMADVMDEIN